MENEAVALAKELEGNLPQSVQNENDPVVVQVELLNRVIAYLRGER